MGIRSALRLVTTAEQTIADVQAGLALASPFQTEDPGLASVVWADVYRDDPSIVLPMTRSQAMKVAPVAAARHLVCPAVARMDLKAYPGTDGSVTPLPVQPPWLTRTDGDVSPFHRMLWTVDDILFSGWSLWLVERGSEAQVLKAKRCPIHRWKFSDSGGVLVDIQGTGTFEPARASKVVLIPGFHEGILNFGSDTIRQAADLLAAANKAAKTPAAQVELHYDGDTPLTDPEIDALTARWVKARQGQNGGVAYTSKNVKAIEHGAMDGHMMIEGRNAAAVDVARIIGIRAANIDATNAQASLTYETAETRGGELVTYGLSAYMTAITSRLSLNDVTPNGTSIRFDLEDQIGPTNPATTPGGPTP